MLDLQVLLQAAGMVPDDCALTGLCGLLKPEPPVAPGVMYAAVGLVLIGAYGYVRQRNRANSQPRTATGESGAPGGEAPQ